jgi:hypothetical protein
MIKNLNENIISRFAVVYFIGAVLACGVGYAGAISSRVADTTAF